MSSTNVHSEINNIYCASGQTIPTEKEVKIPPKKVNELGELSTLNVYLGEGMEIAAGDSNLREDGKLLDNSGKEVGKLPSEAYKKLVAKKAEKKAERNTEQSR